MVPLETALSLTGNMQAAYQQAAPSERRLLNQAFFERLEISNEEVVSYVLAEPFLQFSGHKPEPGEDKEALLARLGPGWNETLAPVENGIAEPFEASRNAKTPGLAAEGSNVENLVQHY